MWSSKPKPREYSGFMGDTSPEQDKVVTELKQWIIENNYNPQGRWDEYDYLRFCRARKFVLKDVQLMWTNHLEWRKKNSIDDINKTFEFPERNQVEAIYPQFYHGTDKLGRPVYYERLGTLDVPKLFTITTEQKMMRNYAYAFEVLFAFRYPACSAKCGKRIDQSTTILDMTGFGITSMTSQVRNLLQTAAALTSDNYPENMGCMFVVNAPFIFSGAWAVVKGFLDERTVRKIKILGSSFQKEVSELVDLETLPSFLGGKCKCESLGGCMKSNIGPWQEYVEVFPFGIQRKDGVAEGLLETQLASLSIGQIEETKDQK